MAIDLNGESCPTYDSDEGIQYWYNADGILVMTYDDSGDWWMTDISTGTQCYYYAEEEQAICYYDDGNYLHYYEVAEDDIEDAFKL